MARLCLYVPDAVAGELKRRARAQGKTVSRFLADLVSHEVGGDWPPKYFAAVVGGWKGGPLERGRQGEYEPRGEV